MSTVVELEGVEHVQGTLYRVRNDLIQFAEPSGEGLSFQNPRHMLSKAKPKGFSKEEMEQLYESIRTEGLEHPIRLRITQVGDNEVLQVVNGERRTRTIRKLIADKANCYDPVTEEWKPASELYDYVECRITEMDDQTAFKMAFSTNDRAVPIGEGATIALIKAYRNAGWTDDQILNVTGYSVSWLRETDQLLNLDDNTLEALSNDQINRAAALELAKLSNVQDRIEVLKEARDKAIERLTAIKLQLEKEIESAELKAEIAEAEAAEAEYNEDEIAKDEAENKLERLRRKAETKRKKASEINPSAPRITSKDLAAAKKKKAEQSGGDDVHKPLTRSKLLKFWKKPVSIFIKAGGVDEDGKEIDCDLEDARLVKLCCDQFEKGEKDIFKILKHHRKQKAKRAEGNDEE